MYFPLQMLRTLELIECGSKQNKGIPIKLTRIGTIILRGYRITAVHSAPDREAGVQFPLTPRTLNNITQYKDSDNYD